MKLSNIRKEYVLLIILIVGFLLRIYNLGGESIWFDEAGSAYYAKLNIFNLFKTVSSGDCTPPLYYIILHYWVGMFGASEFSLRFLSVIFGSFSIYFLYKIGALLFNKNIGILSSLIISLSSFHIYYSQEARSYSLMVLLTLLSLYFLIKILTSRNLAVSIGYIIVSILLIYTHIYGIFIIVVQNIYILTLYLLSHKTIKTNVFKVWILFQSIIVIAYMPWIFFGLIKQIELVHHYHWYPAPKIMQIISTIRQYSGSSRIFLIFFPVFAFLSTVGFKIDYKKPMDWKNLFDSIKKLNVVLYISEASKIYFLLLWFILPIILPFLISIYITPIYVIRLTITASLAFYIITAKGINDIIEKHLKSKWIKLTIISILIIFSARSIWESYNTIKNEQWKEVTNFVNHNASSGDLIVFYPGDKFILFAFDYYTKRNDLVYKPFLEDTLVNDKNIKELISFSKNYKRIWILQRCKDPKGIIKKNLREFNDLAYNKIYDDKNYAEGNEELELTLFEKRSNNHIDKYEFHFGKITRKIQAIF